ncbi:hypothetical protein AB0M02_12630 [Actinoplanes sp. NPDC051861]|uniref:YqeB family protein n=1 Tax=Actinoplanes sp. NPDC051861 TaxID=3155170 RepID=UPI003427221C
MKNEARESVVLSLSGAGRVLVMAGPVALGVLLAVVLPPIARWAVGLGIGLPFGPVWRVVGSMDTWWKVAIQVAILGLLGVLATIEILRRTARVTVTAERVRFDVGDEHRTLARSDIEAIFLDGSVLVVLDLESRQAFRGEPQAEAATLERVFREFGYPWRDADPFAGLYQPWSPESGQVPVAVEAVLAARAVAVRKRAGRESAELREALQKLGYEVRDDGDRQSWRPLVRP